MSEEELKKSNEEVTKFFLNEETAKENVIMYLNQKIDNWKHEELNIAVTGRTGVGKSTFINAIRDNLQDIHNPLYAAVGHKETTMIAKRYPHPSNEKLVLWDLPGVGNRTFSRKTYMSDKRINFQLYDLFFILNADRFLDDDNWLVEEIIKSKKLFFFVRTKVDVELDNDRKRLKQHANPENVLKVIRDDCMSNIKQINGVNKAFSDLYLIGSLEIENPKLEFDKLVARVIDGLPGLKKEVLIYSLQIQTTSLLRAKKQALLKRLWTVSLLSACGSLLPIAGCSYACTLKVICKEIKFYRQQLGQKRDDIKCVSDSLHMQRDEFIKKFDLKYFSAKSTEDGIYSHLVAMAPSLLAEAAKQAELSLKISFPCIGLLISGSLSFSLTYRYLHYVLKTMIQNAKKINSILQDRVHSADDVAMSSDTHKKRKIDAHETPTKSQQDANETPKKTPKKSKK